MEYVQEILNRFAHAKLQGRKSRNKRFVDSVPCAYCRGSGVDPKYGNLSRCSVCGASGKLTVTPPVVACLKCRGSGREGSGMTCLACKGWGVASVSKDAGTCVTCLGTGKDGVFYCIPCKGQGIV